jgi:3-oxoacyl-[acyl-carrier-protein] synthase-1
MMMALIIWWLIVASSLIFKDTSLFMARRVVITGMGIWSCLGTDIETVRQSLFEGKSGIGMQPERLEYGYRSGLTGIVETPIITKQMIDRHTRAGMSEEAQYAYMASRQAFAQAQISDEYLRENEVGCIFGNDSSAKSVIESSKIMDKGHDSALLGYGSVFQSMNSTVTMNLSTILHLRGANFTISAACSSGSHSIGLGYMLIKQGLQDMVLCGGAQETNYYSMASFDALGAFSIRMSEPTKASRPFDKDRDGLIPSGGAAALVLEDYDHAIARGATILAEVVGYGFSSNGGGISEPSDNGSVIAMSRAMKDAGVELDDIDYINAHATSTLQGDMYEAIALDRLFHGQRALISSTKSMTGHECWMAGASEIVYSIIMMQNNFVAPNINFENPDEYSEKINLTAKTVETEVNTVLSNSFGFGGTNSALVIKK